MLLSPTPPARFFLWPRTPWGRRFGSTPSLKSLLHAVNLLLLLLLLLFYDGARRHSKAKVSQIQAKVP
jgi:hypothetical protein